MFWDRVKKSVEKSEEKAGKTDTGSKEAGGTGAGSESFDENTTSDVDEKLLEFRLELAREKLQEKGVSDQEIEEIFAKIKGDGTGESLRALLADLD